MTRGYEVVGWQRCLVGMVQGEEDRERDGDGMPTMQGGGVAG